MITAALDTSCGASLAIARDERIIFHDMLPGRQREADRDLVPWLQAGLAQAEVQAAAVQRWTVGVGPGSFSGVRSGIALVRGICAGTGAACRGMPSSTALACALAAARADAPDCTLGVLHDGRCGQVILSRYRYARGSVQAVGMASAEEPAALVEPNLLCDHYVTVHASVVLPLLPEAIRLTTTAVAGIEARFLLVVQAGEWPVDQAAATASMEPVYVRPPVFVAPHLPSVGDGP